MAAKFIKIAPDKEIETDQSDHIKEGLGHYVVSPRSDFKRKANSRQEAEDLAQLLDMRVETVRFIPKGKERTQE